MKRVLLLLAVLLFSAGTMMAQQDKAAEKAAKKAEKEAKTAGAAANGRVRLSYPIITEFHGGRKWNF